MVLHVKFHRCCWVFCFTFRLFCGFDEHSTSFLIHLNWFELLFYMHKWNMCFWTFIEIKRSKMLTLISIFFFFNRLDQWNHCESHKMRFKLFKLNTHATEIAWADCHLFSLHNINYFRRHQMNIILVMSQCNYFRLNARQIQ